MTSKTKIYGGRYRVIDRIGEGGMATVYLAVDDKIGRRVAIKVLHEHMERNVDIRNRFQMEAQAISYLDHPNIVKIYDFSGAESEHLWIVTEVIQGKNLAEIAQRLPNHRMHPVISACVVREVCKALHRAHTSGIVHRDIKPENVMLTVEGQVKLMDFGIAKDLQKSQVTMTGTFMGSPSYMSPEQIRGRDIDHRSDIYSLSVLFYEIATGRLPFQGQTTHDVVMRIVEGHYPFPRFIVQGINLEVDAMVVRGMSREPGQRFQNIEEYAKNIDAFLEANGFVESHVELERFFRDPQAYETRLAAATAHHPAPQKPDAFNAAQTQRLSQIAGQPQQPAHLASAPHTKNRRLPTQAVPHVSRRSRNPSVISAQRNGQQYNGANNAQSPQNQSPRQTNANVAAAKPQTNYAAAPQERAYFGTAQAANTMNLPHAKRQGRQVFWPGNILPHLRQTGNRQRPRVPRRHSSVRILPPAVVDRTFQGADSVSLILGFLFVGVIGLLSLWGFWELHNRAKNRPENAISLPAIKSSNSNFPRIESSTGRSNPFRKPAKLSRTPNTVIVQTRRPLSTNSTAASIPAPRSEKLASAPTNENNAQSQTQPAPSSTKKNPPPSQTVAAVSPPSKEWRAESTTPPRTKNQERPKVRREASKNRAQNSDNNQTANLPAQTPAASTPTPPPSQPNSSNPVSTNDSNADSDSQATTPAQPQSPPPPRSGEVFLTSQPAAEIFVDGKRLGTTIDSTNGSGWLSFSTGSHSLELRREGYATYRDNFNVKGGERRRLSPILLKQQNDNSDTSANYFLTLSVHPLPAKAIIRNLDRNTSTTITIDDENKIVQLASGHYTVRVERGKASQERELNLTGTTRQVTFSAELRDSGGTQ